VLGCEAYDACEEELACAACDDEAREDELAYEVCDACEPCEWWELRGGAMTGV
jgi:hypothetical protein